MEKEAMGRGEQILFSYGETRGQTLRLQFISKGDTEFAAKILGSVDGFSFLVFVMVVSFLGG
jgi:hypothetical protein